METKENGLLTIKDLERIFQVTSVTIWSWIKKGIIPRPFKVGRNNYFNKDEIDLVIEKHQKISSKE